MNLLDLIVQFYSTYIFTNNSGYFDEFDDFFYIENNGVGMFPLSYLTYIFSIITMVAILVICCKVIKGIYNQVAHLLN